MAANPYTPAAYTGDGSTTAFAVPFPYLQRADVIALVNGTPTAVTWTSDGTLTITPAPVAGAVVSILRQTGFAPYVQFTAGGLRSYDLNVMAQQALYVIQEGAQFGVARPAFVNVSAISTRPLDTLIRVKNSVPTATTIQLLPAALAGFPITVKDASRNASSGPITILPASGELIEGYASYILNTDGQAVTLYPIATEGYDIR